MPLFRLQGQNRRLQTHRSKKRSRLRVAGVLAAENGKCVTGERSQEEPERKASQRPHGAHIQACAVTSPDEHRRGKKTASRVLPRATPQPRGVRSSHQQTFRSRTTELSSSPSNDRKVIKERDERSRRRNRAAISRTDVTVAFCWTDPPEINEAESRRRSFELLVSRTVRVADRFPLVSAQSDRACNAAPSTRPSRTSQVRSP